MGAAIANALGTVRRGSRLSPPMNDADSGQVQANAIVAQKTVSARPKRGTIVCRVIGVAVPKRRQIASPRATSRIVSSQRAIAPALLSHFALASPRTLSATATPRAAIEKQMK